MTKGQGPGVALVLLRKGKGAQHPSNATDDATNHRAQQQPPDTTGSRGGVTGGREKVLLSYIHICMLVWLTDMNCEQLVV